MSVSRRTSQGEAVRLPGGRVPGEWPSLHFVLPASSPRGASGGLASCRAPRWGGAWSGGVRSGSGRGSRIPIAVGAELVVPSNPGMKLTTGRWCPVPLSVCLLRFVRERSMVTLMPVAAYP
jgi:hypothetical protein